MATLKYFFPYKKSDGTIRVKIKLHHDGQRRIFSTDIYLLPTDITKSGNIKSQSIKDEIESLLHSYRQRIQELGVRTQSMTIDQIMEYIVRPVEQDIDFFAYAEKVIARMTGEGKKGTARTYQSAINSLENFLGKRSLPINKLTSRLLFDYAESLKTARNRSFKNNKVQVGKRAVSLYTGIFKAILNKAKLEFNDDDLEVMPVRVNPFLKFKVPAEELAKKKALSIEEIRLIRDSLPSTRRGQLAKDCFLISFCLLGINSVDLYKGVEIKDGRITYERQKTRSRRKDRAEISVKVEPEAKEILEKYLIKNKSVFHKLYSDHLNLNRAINKGLIEIGNLTGIEDLKYYAARHSWATIAVNDCGIDKYVVHQALNHSDETMKVTDLYIKKDWSLNDKANRKVLDYLTHGELSSDHDQ